MMKTVLTAALFAIGLSSCSEAASPSKVQNVPTPAPAAALPAAASATPLVTGLPDFTALVEKEGKAVVNISTTQVIRRNQRLQRFEDDDDGFDIFRRFGFPAPPRSQPQPRTERAQSLGSGFIIESDGYILTNAHVIADADEIKVKLADKREFKAKVIGSDARTDVAVLKIDAKNLPTVDLGSSQKLKVGEWVVAIGSPYGLENTVTAGIVSATKRDLPDESYVQMIQTDAAVNPGNSGGPLFNMYGEVIGINAQIYSRSGGYMGLSFAIPIDDAKLVVEQLRDKGKVTRGRIGVGIQEVSQDMATALGRDNTNGALISNIEADGPAAKAGLQNGDIIVKFNGQGIGKSSDLPRIVGSAKPGSSVPVEVWRDKASKIFTIKVGEMEQASEGRSAEREYRGKQQENAFSKPGLTVEPADPRLLKQLNQRQFDIKFALQVRSVDGPAARAGIQPGDLIVGVGSDELKSLKQLEDAFSKAKPGSAVALRLIRGGQLSLYVAVTLPKKGDEE